MRQIPGISLQRKLLLWLLLPQLVLWLSGGFLREAETLATGVSYRRVNCRSRPDAWRRSCTGSSGPLSWV